MDLYKPTIPLLVASGGLVEDEMHAILPVVELQLGLDTLAHPLCSHGLQPPLELRLANVYVKLFELYLKLLNGQISALRVDPDEPLPFGWREGYWSTMPRLVLIS